MNDLLIRLGIACAAIAATYYAYGFAFTLDSQRFLETPRPSPFHARWVLPTLLGNRGKLWALVTLFSLVVSCLLFPGDPWAVAMWVSMPWFRTMARIPVLADAPAMALSLAAYHVRGPWLYPFALLGAGISEKTPVFMSLFAWDVWPAVVGLAAFYAAYRLIRNSGRCGKVSALATGRNRALRLFDAKAALAPWGMGLLALLNPDWALQDAIVVVIAYAQWCVAHDTVRMSQWAAPVILPKAIAVMPLQWRPLYVALTWFNPWAFAKKGEARC